MTVGAAIVLVNSTICLIVAAIGVVGLVLALLSGSRGRASNL
jgi:hypothetical protein